MIGSDVVANCAANAAGLPPTAAITAARIRTKSIANAGKRPY
jgi:hypothetical protein